MADKKAPDEKGVQATTFLPQSSIYAKEPDDQLKMAKTLLAATPSIKIVVEVPRYAHDLLLAYHGNRLPAFYNLAVQTAVRHWADSEFDTTTPARLEVYRAFDRLATARSILSWLRFGSELEGAQLEELEELESK